MSSLSKWPFIATGSLCGLVYGVVNLIIESILEAGVGAITNKKERVDPKVQELVTLLKWGVIGGGTGYVIHFLANYVLRRRT